MAHYFEAALADVTPDPDLHTFTRTITLHLKAVYDTEVAYFTTAAEQADEIADTYRSHLGVA